MAPPADEGRTNGERNFRSLLSALLEYFQARLQLAGIESREAFGHYLKALLWVILALLGIVFGYVFFIAGAVFLLAHLLSAPWYWIMLGCGLLHLILAGVCVTVARRLLATPMFSGTLAEFTRDREWLKRGS